MVFTLSASAHSTLKLKAVQLVLTVADRQARVKRMRSGTRGRSRQTVVAEARLGFCHVNKMQSLDMDRDMATSLAQEQQTA